VKNTEKTKIPRLFYYEVFLIVRLCSTTFKTGLPLLLILPLSPMYVFQGSVLSGGQILLQSSLTQTM